MRVTCPHCYTPLSLESLTEDLSARDLFAIIANLGHAGAPLIAYLGLFKPRTQALRWSRALALADQVMDLATQYGADGELLAAALTETVESLRERRQANTWQPLSGHRYLTRVLETMAAQRTTAPAVVPQQDARAPLTSKGAAGLAGLETWKHGNR